MPLGAHVPERVLCTPSMSFASRSAVLVGLICTAISCRDPNETTGGGGSGGETTTLNGGSPTTGGGGSTGGSNPDGGGGTTSLGGGGATGGGGADGGAGGTGGDGGAGGESDGGGGSGGGGETARVRIVAANLTSGSGQSYSPGHGIRILQGLDADITLIQEFNYLQDTTANIRNLVDQICGVTCEYVRGPATTIPNGIVSKYPIVESGSWTDNYVADRTHIWARIDVPGDTDLWAISVHLLGSSSTNRSLQATQLIGLIDANVPASAYLTLGGDFNTRDRGETAVVTLGGMFNVAAPWPVDNDGNDLTNGPRDEPYDWVLADSDLDPFAIPTVIGQTTFSAGAVIDTRVYDPISEISPAMSTDSGVNGMQHMAVVRDFELPL